MILPRTHGSQQGDPAESDRLRPLFLAWIGRRSNGAGLVAAGIDHAHGMAWLAGTRILRDDYQRRVRDLLKQAAAAAPAHRRLSHGDLGWARQEGWVR